MSRKIDPLRLINSIYEAAVDVQAWAGALIGIAGALEARATSLTIADPGGTKPPFLIAPRNDPEWLRTYGERWSTSNPVRERGVAFPAGAVYQFEDLMPRSEFERTGFYNEFWAPQRQDFALFTNAARRDDAVAGIGFYRSRNDGRFAAEDERLLNALTPHLQRAVALNLRLARIEMERNSTAEMLNRCDHGALLVDAEARILFANTAAETLLREGMGLCAKDGRLTARVPFKANALQAMIAGGKDGVPGGALALSCLDGRTLAVVVVPLRAETTWLPQRPAAIVFVKDPRHSALPSRDEIKLLFGLTAAQASLAREMLRGDGVDAAARRLGIARSTARTHLLEIFQRTGTRRQAELVRVILQHSLPASRAS